MFILLGQMWIGLILHGCIGTDVRPDTLAPTDLSQVEILGLNDSQVFINQSINLSARFTNAQGEEVSTTFDWSSTNPAVAVIDGNGVLSTLSLGQTTIIASAQGTRDSMQIEVINNPEAVAEIAIQTPESQSSLLIGESFTIEANIMNADGESVPNTELTWISSDTTVATVDPTGLVQALATGQTLIHAEFMGITSNDLLITVVTDNTQIASITLNAPTDQIEIGEEFTFTAVARNNEGNAIDGLSFEWSSSDSEVLSIDENGLATGLSAGEATVTAQSGDIKSQPLSVRVIDVNQVANVSISAPSNSLEVGDNLQFSATATNAQGNAVDINNIIWQSNQPALMTIDESGLATALASGTVQVTAVVDEVTSNTLTVAISEPSMTASRSGDFQGQNGYRTEGTAVLRILEDGTSLSLDLQENFGASNGPGLFVYLSNSRTSVGGGIELGPLQSNAGAQSYAVPAGVSLTQYNFVLIFCRPFSVPFGAAELEP